MYLHRTTNQFIEPLSLMLVLVGVLLVSVHSLQAFAGIRSHREQ